VYHHYEALLLALYRVVTIHCVEVRAIIRATYARGLCKSPVAPYINQFNRNHTNISVLLPLLSHALHVLLRVRAQPAAPAYKIVNQRQRAKSSDANLLSQSFSLFLALSTTFFETCLGGIFNICISAAQDHVHCATTTTNLVCHVYQFSIGFSSYLDLSFFSALFALRSSLPILLFNST
jgi:hypothetical protein